MLPCLPRLPSCPASSSSCCAFLAILMMYVQIVPLPHHITLGSSQASLYPSVSSLRELVQDHETCTCLHQRYAESICQCCPPESLILLLKPEVNLKNTISLERVVSPLSTPSSHPPQSPQIACLDLDHDHSSCQRSPCTQGDVCVGASEMSVLQLTANSRCRSAGGKCGAADKCACGVCGGFQSGRDSSSHGCHADTSLG